MVDAPARRGEVHMARGKLAEIMGDLGSQGIRWVGGAAAAAGVVEEVGLRSDPELTGLLLVPVQIDK